MQAINKAINHPLLDAVALDQAQGVIVNFRVNSALPFEELNDALNLIKRSTGEKCEIIPGVMLDESMGEDCEVILIATGIGCTDVSDPEVAYLRHFGKPEVPANPEQKIQSITPAQEEKKNDILSVPSYLRNRQIPIELIEEEYAKRHLRPDLQPDL